MKDLEGCRQLPHAGERSSHYLDILSDILFAINASRWTVHEYRWKVF